MPAGDRTGPYGAGPLTGRGMGYCAGFPYPGWMNRSWGGGFGRSWGAGRGFFGYRRRGRWWRNTFFAPACPPAYHYGSGYPVAPAPYPAVPYPWVW
ncbi:MAG: DUF5320 domain-containing protein [Desulfotomaculales bacterium]